MTEINGSAPPDAGIQSLDDYGTEEGIHPESGSSDEYTVSDCEEANSIPRMIVCKLQNPDLLPQGNPDQNLQSQDVGRFYADLNDLLSQEFGENVIFEGSAYYEGVVKREIANLLRGAALMGASNPLPPQTQPPFSVLLNEYYTRPVDRVGPVFFRAKFDPLDYAEVDTVDHLLMMSHDETIKLFDEFTIISQIANLFFSDNPKEVVEVSYSLATGMQLLYREKAHEHPHEMYTLSRLESLADPNENVDFNEAMDEIATLTWEGMPFLLAAGDYFDKWCEDFNVRVAAHFFDQYLISPKVTALSEDGDLPADLRYRAMPPFKTQEQVDLYFQLIGQQVLTKTVWEGVEVSSSPEPERDQWDEAINPYPQVIETPLARAMPTDEIGPPQNAGDILSHYRRTLSTDFTTAMAHLKQLHDKKSLNQIATFYRNNSVHQVKDDGEWTPKLAHGENIYSNPDAAHLKRARERIYLLMSEMHPSLNLHELAILHSAQFQSLYEDMKGLITRDADLMRDIAVLNVTEFTTIGYDSREIISVFEKTLLYILSYLQHGITQSEFQHTLALGYERLGKILQVYRAKQGDHEALTQSIWQGFLQEVIDTLKSHSSEMKAASDIYLPEYFSHYEGLIAFLEAIKENKNLPVFNEIDTRQDEIVSVLDFAIQTLNIPESYDQALSQWKDYQGIQDKLKTKNFRDLKDSNLSHAILGFLNGETTASVFKERADHELAVVENLKDLRAYVSSLDSLGDGLEKNILSHLRPWQAEKFMNRFRFVVCLLDNHVRLAEERERLHSLTMDEFVQMHINEWVRRLPNGWPNSEGHQQKYGVLDEKHRPIETSYLTKEELIHFIQGRRCEGEGEQSEHKVEIDHLREILNFFASYNEGYYRSFSYVNTLRDQTRYDSGAFRDHDDINVFVNGVLKKVYQEAVFRAEHEHNEEEKKRLVRIGEFCALASTGIQRFLNTQPEHPVWVSKDNKEIVNVVPHRVYTKPPSPIDYGDSKDEALYATRAVILDYYRHAKLPIEQLLRGHGFATWYAGLKGENDLPQLDMETSTMEWVLNKIDPPADGTTTYSDWVIENSWMGDDLYFLGLLAERMGASLSSETKERYRFLKDCISLVPSADFEAILAQIYAGTCEWEGEPNPEHPLLPETISLLRRLHMSPAEKLWVVGRIENIFEAAGQEEEANDDSIYIQDKRFREFDNYLFSLTRDEAEKVAKKIFSKLGVDDIPLENMDQETVVKIASAINQHYTPSIKAQRKERMKFFAEIDANSPQRLFSDGEMVYALAYLADKDNEDFLAELAQRINEYDERFSQENVINHVSQLSEEEVKIFYKHVYWDTVGQYSMIVNTMLDDDEVALGFNTAKFWLFVDRTMKNPDEYYLNGEINTAKVISELDPYLRTFVPDGKGPTLLQHTAYLIDTGLTDITAEMRKYRDEGIKGIDDKYQLLLAIREIVLGKYNKSDPQEVATHSVYDPNWFVVERFKEPLVGLEDAFSLPQLNAFMVRDGKKEITDTNILKDIRRTFAGIHTYFRRTRPPAFAEIDGDIIYYSDGSLYFVLDDERFLVDPETLEMTSLKDNQRINIEDDVLARGLLSRACEQFKKENACGAIVTGAECSPNDFPDLRDELKFVQTVLDVRSQAFAKAEEEANINYYWRSSKALTAIVKYFPQLTAQALVIKERAPEAIPNFTADELISLLGYINQRLELHRDDLVFPLDEAGGLYAQNP